VLRISEVTSPSGDRVRTPTMCLSMMTKDRPVLRGVKVSSVTTCALRMTVREARENYRTWMKSILGGVPSCSGAEEFAIALFSRDQRGALLWKTQRKICKSMTEVPAWQHPA